MDNLFVLLCSRRITGRVVRNYRFLVVFPVGIMEVFKQKNRVSACLDRFCISVNFVKVTFKLY